MQSREIVNALKALRFENTFNPYVESCPIHDIENAPDHRCEYLAEILDRAAASGLEAIWVGRDLGHRGGRRTGLALTDDVHFAAHLKRWGLVADKPLCDGLLAERTATVIWDVLARIQRPIFLWNIFPFHPFNKGKTLSNRKHTARERQAGLQILSQIINYTKPKRIIAVGNDAFNALSAAFPNHELLKARHPSYGGHRDFTSAMESFYPECQRSMGQ